MQNLAQIQPSIPPQSRKSSSGEKLSGMSLPISQAIVSVTASGISYRPELFFLYALVLDLVIYALHCAARENFCAG